jgi:hypothetical protein
MMKPAANQASRQQQKKGSWRQITFCRKRWFHHIWQQNTETPSDVCGGSQGHSKVIRQLLQPVVEGLNVVLSSLRPAQSLTLTFKEFILNICYN